MTPAKDTGLDDPSSLTAALRSHDSCRSSAAEPEDLGLLRRSVYSWGRDAVDVADPHGDRFRPSKIEGAADEDERPIARPDILSQCTELLRHERDALAPLPFREPQSANGRATDEIGLDRRVEYSAEHTDVGPDRRGGEPPSHTSTTPRTCAGVMLAKGRLSSPGRRCVASTLASRAHVVHRLAGSLASHCSAQSRNVTLPEPRIAPHPPVEIGLHLGEETSGLGLRAEGRRCRHVHA